MTHPLVIKQSERTTHDGLDDGPRVVEKIAYSSNPSSCIACDLQSRKS